MIWATVSSQYCFCWLYRASPTLAEKNIISLISVLTMVKSMFRVFSCVVGRGCLLWPVRSLGKTLLPFALLHFVFQGQICRLLQVSLDFLLFHSSSVQFSLVPQSCLTLCDPMNCSTPGLPVHHQLPEFTQTHVHRVSDTIQPSHPRSSPSPAPNPSQHQSLFQWINSSNDVAKVLEFQL